MGCMHLWMMIFIALVIQVSVTEVSGDGVANNLKSDGFGRSLIGSKHINVEIDNLLEYGQTLTLHCKSGDKDLGVQTIPNNGKWSFGFGANIWGTTLYFCGFTWDNKLHWFDVYKSDYDCRNCVWWVTQSAPCLANDNKSGICYKWNNS